MFNCTQDRKIEEVVRYFLNKTLYTPNSTGNQNADNNLRGLLGISKDRSERIQAIATSLSTGRFDIVCLQELWLQKDFNTIRESVAKVLPYSHYFYSGVTGSGLCILSRWPFEAIMFHQWPLNGYIHKIFHGDWFGGKGVGLCRIIAQGIHINIYTTHLHAQYNPDDDEYLAHRVVQAFDTAQFIRLTSDAAHISILAGDLNTQPEELCYQLIQHTAQLLDAYDAHTNSSATGTFCCSRNSYADIKSVANNPDGERIDHIFYKPGLGAKVVLESYTMPFEERVPICSFSYSDHEAIASKFKISAGGNHNQPHCIIRSKKELQSALILGMTVIDEAQHRIYWDKVCYWSITTALIFGMVTVSIFSDIPQIYSRTYQITLVAFTGITIFSSVMATVWNQIESHGLLSTHKTMQVLLDRVVASELPDFISDCTTKTEDLMHVHQRAAKSTSNM